MMTKREQELYDALWYLLNDCINFSNGELTESILENASSVLKKVKSETDTQRLTQSQTPSPPFIFYCKKRYSMSRTGLILRQWVERDGCKVTAYQAYAWDTGCVITSRTETLRVFKFHIEGN